MSDMIQKPQLETPVLIVAFNRISTAREVFDAVKKVEPKKLYVAVDAARPDRHGESEKVAKVRDFFLNSIDWPCELKTLFHETNQGCKFGVVKALKWMFSQEEMGIILEDDCVPNQSFFWFCQELLIKYKDDTRIGQISGCNTAPNYHSPYSYHISTGGSILGWATWKRVVDTFEIDAPILKSPNIYKYLLESTNDPIESKHITDAIDAINSGKLTTCWDYSWGTLLKINSQYSLVSSVSMVKNIGLDIDPTHKIKPQVRKLLDIKLKEVTFPIKHPDVIIPDRKFSRKQARPFCTPLYKRFLRRIPLVLWFYRNFFKKSK